MSRITEIREDYEDLLKFISDNSDINIDEYIYHLIPKNVEFAKKLKEVVQMELDCRIL